jgi:putative membrane protein
MHPAQKFVSLGLLVAAVFYSAHAHARSDAAFMKEAAHAGAAEIEASKLAVAKARNADVKAFANSMIADHTKVADELKALAATKNVTLPDAPSVKQKAEIKLIDAGDNDKFDERYAKAFGVKAHEETIQLFEEASREAKDPEVKAWAQKTLPGLKHHLEMAKALTVAPKK